MLCKLGPARLRPHKAVVSALAMQLRKTGAEVDLERVVPELLEGAPETPTPPRPE